MSCIICKCNTDNPKDKRKPEVFINGHRVDLCNKEKCYKELGQKQRKIHKIK